MINDLNDIEKWTSYIKILKKYNIPLTLAMTIIKDNFNDEKAVIEFAKKQNLRIDVTGFVSKSVRGASTDPEHTRLASECVAERVCENEKITRVEKLVDIYEKLLMFVEHIIVLIGFRGTVK